MVREHVVDLLTGQFGHRGIFTDEYLEIGELSS
jgi:hypothetical protein